jgi:hypothetical protein
MSDASGYVWRFSGDRFWRYDVARDAWTGECRLATAAEIAELGWRGHRAARALGWNGEHGDEFGVVEDRESDGS